MAENTIERIYIKRIFIAIIVLVLAVLSFLLIRPIILSIVLGLILAFVFNPVYDWLRKTVKSKNLSASILCVVLILLILLPIWFFTPILLNQALKIYTSAQQMDFVTPLKTIFPSLFASQQFSSEIGSILHSFVAKTANSFVNAVSNIILNFIPMFLQLLVVFFTFFFVLRDKDKLVPYLKGISPLSGEVEKKLIEYSVGITSSVLYGQVIVGIFQGLVVGAGFFIFGVPNALILTLLAIVAGILPIIGPPIVWVPVVVYFLAAGSALPAIGVAIAGVIASTTDNFLRSVIVSRRTSVHSSVILVGMIGGFFFFGVLGFILGPLILSYLLIGVEVYRKKDKEGGLIVHPSR